MESYDELLAELGRQNLESIVAMYIHARTGRELELYHLLPLGEYQRVTIELRRIEEAVRAAAAGEPGAIQPH